MSRTRLFAATTLLALVASLTTTVTSPDTSSSAAVGDDAELLSVQEGPRILAGPDGDAAEGGDPLTAP